MIAIENMTPDRDLNSPSIYRIRINDKTITTFNHTPDNGLETLFRLAAYSVSAEGRDHGILILETK